MIDFIDWQLGTIESVNEDDTIDIRDFRTGELAYRRIPFSDAAGDQYKPAVGHYVLFFTMQHEHSAQHIVKIVKLFGSLTTDSNLIASSPTNLEEGERRFVSLTGATIYVANGGIYIGSNGQSIIFSDKEQKLKVLCNKLNLYTRDGFLIKQEGNQLIIQKGTNLKKEGTSYTVDSPTLTITLEGDKVSLVGDTVSLNIDCKEATLNITETTKLTSNKVEVDCPEILLGDTDAITIGQAKKIIDVLNRLISEIRSHVHVGNLGAPTSTPTTPFTNPQQSEIETTKTKAS